MCVFFIAIQPYSPYVLIAASNRDTFFTKETLNAAFWDPDHPNILAGRDKEAGGTWMGVTRDGKFATVTNIPSTYGTKRANSSRGLLVSEFLSSGCNQSPQDYCQSVLSNAHLYSGFNLITAKFSPSAIEVAYGCNRPTPTAYLLLPGVYGLSNQHLNSPVKKLAWGKPKFAELVSSLQEGRLDEVECEKQLLDLLCDDTCLYPDENYPALGFPEKILEHITSVFVTPTKLYGEPFGTRTNTVVMVSTSGKVTYVERTRAWPQDHWETNRFTFCITV